MTKIAYASLIKETAKELRCLEKEQQKAFVRDRIRFLRLLKTGWCSSQAAAGAFIGLSARSSQRLWHRYRKEGLQGLLTYPYQGTSCRLSDEQTEELIAYLAQDQVQFLHEAKAYIHQHFGVGYSTAGLHKLFERLRVKKKTGRPTNYRKDEKGAGLFKKSLVPL